ncbi:unnamed protein product, partial [marine sediment metagenome]
SLGYNMTDLRGALFVQATHGDLVEIIGSHKMREDIVRVANGAADIRYRAEYPVWSATLNIRFNAGIISEEEVVQIFSAAGFSCGIGEWRPEKSATGSYGLWDLG